MKLAGMYRVGRRNNAAATIKNPDGPTDPLLVAIRLQRGFSLIELLVVIVIIGVLAAVVAPRFFGRTEQGNIAAARAQISNLSVALDNYQLDTGYYPSSSQGLAALFQKPSGTPAPRNWRGPYLKARETPLDPWGNPYVYLSPGKVNVDWYDLTSFGKDGAEGGSDDDADITNR